MERKEFIKQLGLGALIAPAAVLNNYQDGENLNLCIESPRETAGPFPTKDPSGLIISDIRSDRTGIEMTVNITVQDRNKNCLPLPGALVDIWHCDKDGNYSEYGGSGMQSNNFQNVKFLRGRQKSDTKGQVTFKTIFPGWYRGRAPHIHVEVFDSTGKSLLITQIAFPMQVSDTVYTRATQYYTKGKQDTANEADGVFADSLNSQVATVSGTIDKGFMLSNAIIVSA
jgi:protocatechuate 3,4-dioxygenase beta subunit